MTDSMQTVKSGKPTASRQGPHELPLWMVVIGAIEAAALIMILALLFGGPFYGKTAPPRSNRIPAEQIAKEQEDFAEKLRADSQKVVRDELFPETELRFGSAEQALEKHFGSKEASWSRQEKRRIALAVQTVLANVSVHDPAFSVLPDFTDSNSGVVVKSISPLNEAFYIGDGKAATRVDAFWESKTGTIHLSRAAVKNSLMLTCSLVYRTARNAARSAADAAATKSKNEVKDLRTLKNEREILEDTSNFHRRLCENLHRNRPEGWMRLQYEVHICEAELQQTMKKAGAKSASK